MSYYNSREEDSEYNRGIPQPMRREKFRDNDQGKRFKDDKRKRREAFERKRGG